MVPSASHRQGVDSPRGRSGFVAAWTLSSLILGASSALFAGSKIQDAIPGVLRSDGKAVVIVSFRPPISSRPGAAATADQYVASVAQVSDQIANLADAHGVAEVRYQYRYVPAVVLRVSELSLLESIASLPAVSGVHLDVRGRAALAESIPAIRADEAYQLGVDGSGAVAVVLDSGLAEDHPAFEGARLSRFDRRFLDQGEDISEDVDDGLGHGTHVSGILASRGSDEEGVPAGVAPGARLITMKVLKDDGSGWVSDWTRALDEILRLVDQEGVEIDVVNMSINTDRVFTSAGECEALTPAFAEACRLLDERNVALFAASGNWVPQDGDGNGEPDEEMPQGIVLPSCFSTVTSVGSVGSDELSEFSLRGELLDLVAPGEQITSAGLLASDFLSTKNGTSQAVPHAAAVACLMRQADQGISSQMIRDVLVETGRTVADPLSEREYRILDARAALESVVGPMIGNLSCDGSGRPIIVRWELIGDATVVQILVHQGETLVHEWLVGSSITSYEREVPAGDYRVTVTPFDADAVPGRSASCDVSVLQLTPFRRGDCNGDSQTDISDVLGLLWSTYEATEIALCRMACDANDDEQVDVSDAVTLLTHLFGTFAAPPPPPFPECGFDQSTGDLDCEASSCGEDA